MVLSLQAAANGTAVVGNQVNTVETGGSQKFVVATLEILIQFV